MEIASLCISILAAFFAVVVYFSHDRRLKEQEKQLNEIALAKAQKENETSIQADIFVEWDGHVFIFDNRGKDIAKNISASCNNYEFDKPFSKSFMQPGERAQRTLRPGCPPERTVVVCKWEDGTGPRSKSYEIDLLPPGI